LLHRVEVFGRQVYVFATLFSLFEQQIEPPLEVLIIRKGLATTNALQNFGFGPQQLRDECAGACIPPRAHLLFHELPQ